ncbi:MAG: hypothetical protein KA085_13830 [Phenylobacterium sp.]|uniref:hypothetical protein n=1 Tax=Phenylobacterium sp. TaxID=1871053 RepID=UPI001B729E57|nr:hypothetical protein [Phenylobacterium sp.]MBP7648799.1 hypothetical protein [Phenylobacterium sp.]MBP7817205.1 hypothetical protein [Phenylobacterium sp.]MBP9231248.1 hypothetical protein [Phenylobacterium sp.]
MEAEAKRLGLTRRWWLILATYVLAAINFGVTRLRLNAPYYEVLEDYAGWIGTVSFLGWCGVACYAALRYGRWSWPMLIGAPFALFTAVGVAWYLVAVLFSGQL